MNFDKFHLFIEYLRANGFVLFRLLWDFTSILKAFTVPLLLHFDSCSAETIIWLSKQMNTLSYQSRCFVKQRWSPVSVKLHGNGFKTGLQHKCSAWAFPDLEQPFCRAHANISLWSLNAFLVLMRESLLCSLSETATHRSTKVTVIQKLHKKGS